MRGSLQTAMRAVEASEIDAAAAEFERGLAVQMLAWTTIRKRRITRRKRYLRDKAKLRSAV